MKDPEKVNDFYVKLTGKASIPEPLLIGHNYELKTQGTVTGLTETDKDDGTHFVYFTYKPVMVELINETGESIKAKDTRSLSQQLRLLIRKKWMNNASSVEFDKVYEKFMYGVIREVDYLMDKYEVEHE